MEVIAGQLACFYNAEVRFLNALMATRRPPGIPAIRDPGNFSLFCFVHFISPIGLFYITSSDIRKMGRNILNTIPPIITPMTTISSGSSMDVRPSSIVSTSS